MAQWKRSWRGEAGGNTGRVGKGVRERERVVSTETGEEEGGEAERGINNRSAGKEVTENG